MNRAPLLFLNVLVIASCGLIYELLAGTVASYVVGEEAACAAATASDIAPNDGDSTDSDADADDWGAAIVGSAKRAKEST